MVAVSASLAAGGGCMTRFWPVRNTSRLLAISGKNISAAKRTKVAGSHFLSCLSLAGMIAEYATTILQPWQDKCEG